MTCTNHLFRPCIPQWMQAQLATTPLFSPMTWQLCPVILYADLQQFSSLSATFATLPNGAELLHEALTLFYETMVATVNAHGGDIVNIAGDSLTVWWPDCDNPIIGQRCGEAMVAALATLPPISTPDGPFYFNVRIGVAAGPTCVALVGTPSHGVHLVLYGSTLQAATVAETIANTGEVRVATTTKQEDPLPCCAPISPDTQQHDGQRQPIRKTPLRLEHFVPSVFGRYLQLGSVPAEYRRCVPVFAAFEMPPSASDLHTLVTQVQRIAFQWGGWLNEVEIGDKGAVFVLLFEAPTYESDNPKHAVGCCLELAERHLITHAAVTVGVLFIGAVGSPSRHVYTVQGDEMNLAAHLMHTTQPGNILVSGRIRGEVAGYYETTSPTFLVVKGHTQLIPVARVITSTYKYISESLMAGRTLPTSRASLLTRRAVGAQDPAGQAQEPE